MNNPVSLNIKVCGMRQPENIQALMELYPDYIGFIFYSKSSRYVEKIDNINFIKQLNGPIKTGVFVNEEWAFIQEKVSKFDLDAIQLHGQESPELCAIAQANQLRVIKVFSVGESFDFQQLEPYLEVCDYFLFDTKGKLAGGNGYTFNWKILLQYPYSKPFFLSGGLSNDNISAIDQLKKLPLYGLDLNSKFEISPALKDIEALETFKQKLNQIQ